MYIYVYLYLKYIILKMDVTFFYVINIHNITVGILIGSSFIAIN